MGGNEYKRVDSSEPTDYAPQEGGVDPRVKEKFSKVCILRRWITVEPAMLMYFMTFSPLIPLTQQFVLSQVRTNMNISATDLNSSACQINTSSEASQLDNQAQAKASQWMIIFNVVLFFPGFFSTIVMGSYSDQRGRKLGLVTPVAGGAVRCLCSALVSYFGWRLEWMFIGLFLEGLSGGAACFIMAGFSYIADITSHAHRSGRIFIVEVALGIGIVVSQMSIGFLIAQLDFAYCFVVCGSLHAMNFLYIVILVIETREKRDDAKLISTKHFVKIYKLFFADTVDHRRWKLLLAMVLLFLSCVIELGSMDNITYFQIHQPLCFSSIIIGYWQAANYAVRNVGGGVMVKYFIRRLGDTGLMVLSFISGIVFYVLVSFTTTLLMMFLVMLGSVMYSLLTPMVRAFTSKLCSKDEQGTVFSGIAMIQTLSILLGAVTFDSIYAATVHTDKGLVFLIEAGFLGVGLILTIVLIVCMRRESKDYLVLEHVVEVPADGIY